MHRISTPYPSHIKIGPYLFYGLLAVVFVLLLRSGAYELSPMLLVAMGVMAVIGAGFVRSALRDCVEEVYDCGDHLLVRKAGEEDTVPLGNIINVNFSKNPENMSARITLRLATPGKFGTEITFAPPPKLYIAFPPRNEIAEDLLVRADRARRG
jgi:hypothetical protein